MNTRIVQLNTSKRIRAADHAPVAKKHVFVAIPFTEDMEDVYHYAIQGATRAAGYLCERADLSNFTGDVNGWVETRIASALLVIADLSGANPNVYHEVGLAQGYGVPTVLLIRENEEPEFNVRGRRCLVYKTIKHLEQILSEELKELECDTREDIGRDQGRAAGAGT